MIETMKVKAGQVRGCLNDMFFERVVAELR